MNWYIAKIVFSISIGLPGKKSQFDEQLRLISAQNGNEAFLKARMIGVREEESFVNQENTPVKWEFIDVAELTLLPELKEGMELHSCIHERDDSESYIRYVQQKAKNIESRLPQHVNLLS